MSSYAIPPEVSDNFTQDEIQEYVSQFKEIDEDGNGTLDKNEMTELMKSLGMEEAATPDKVQALINEVDQDILANKCDTMDEDASVGEAFANSKGIPFCKVSAKTDTNVLKGFRQSFQKVYTERIKNGKGVESDGGLNLTGGDGMKSKKKGCC